MMNSRPSFNVKSIPKQKLSNFSSKWPNHSARAMQVYRTTPWSSWTQIRAQLASHSSVYPIIAQQERMMPRPVALLLPVQIRVTICAIVAENGKYLNAVFSHECSIANKTQPCTVTCAWSVFARSSACTRMPLSSLAYSLLNTTWLPIVFAVGPAPF